MTCFLNLSLLAIAIYGNKAIFFNQYFSFTNLNSSFHDFLPASHVGHAELPQLVVQEPALALPETPLAIDDTCVTREALARAVWAARAHPTGGPPPVRRLPYACATGVIY